MPESFKSFIETQLPVSKLSKESYKERKATNSQTLTSMGKWWGRKPLILVRASIIGMLMPATDNPKKDREIYLKILTMDDAGLLKRKAKSIPLRILYERLTPREREKWFNEYSDPASPKYKKGIIREQKAELQDAVFLRMSYDDRLAYCDRPEQIDGPSEETWKEINAYLGTSATNVVELVQELGKRRFGHIPRVGDAFCGGGSIPFEAARIGCEAYGSDLSPVAALLTWSALHIIGGGEEVAKMVREAQQDVYKDVDRQIVEWGIEHNERGDRADAYLYCCEARCPECGWMIPIVPSCMIGEKPKCLAVLKADEKNKRLDIEIQSGVSNGKLDAARNTGTVGDDGLICPHCHQITPITRLRGDRKGDNGTEYGLRPWENDDIVPRAEDVFQERLYCIRYVHEWQDEEGKKNQERYYVAPDENDLERESTVLDLIRERFCEWQAKGFIPSAKIESGDKTDEPIRTRGWTHWHHLFNHRQLLILGALMERALCNRLPKEAIASMLLGMSRSADYNARLARWHPRSIGDKSEQTFSNQALNTLFTYATRSLSSIDSAFLLDISAESIHGTSSVRTEDARRITEFCDLWITDPPYADAINYHELSEFFLAWYAKQLHDSLFPEWYTDSKRALAVVGTDETFRRSMVDCYQNLAAHMPVDGAQLVMFTHQNASVWADLALILWASGLRVTAAWCIATETESALKEGNYVQGTVLLILRKQAEDATAFLDEIIPEVEQEVRSQLDSMLSLDDADDPNFADTDYQLAAYAAALRVLTKYKRIEEIDVSYELSRTKTPGEKSKIEEVIEDAVRVACDHLVPKGFDTFTWKTLQPEERFYLKGLEIESHGEHRSGAYQELARGFGIRDYKYMLASSKANQIRLKTATEFGRKNLGDGDFDGSLVRHALFAIREIVRTEGDVSEGRNWLRGELRDQYWNNRKTLIVILGYLASRGLDLEHWKEDAEAAKVLAGALENDHAGAV
ncbi:MAG: DUF1156 domain-containing protein [Acidobacteria bacterium]|nr:DUF1156 domain-containing protein [Acidobacteriota bacterium]